MVNNEHINQLEAIGIARLAAIQSKPAVAVMESNFKCFIVEMYV